MSEFSSWQDLLDFLNKLVVKRKTLHSFASIKNDNARRVQLLLEDDKIREALTDWMNGMLKKEEKDLSMSKFHRQEGNHLFSLKDYTSCIETYTLSINTCPPECSEEISLAYANRSAALFHIELYEDCIADIEMALKNSYPSKLCPKVLLRKAKCLQKLGEKEQFQSTVEHLEAAMKVLQIGEQKSMKKEIELLVNSSEDQQNSHDCSTTDLPKLLNGESTEILHTSSALEITYSLEKGRHIVANTDIKAGDTLFVETPAASVVLPDFNDSRCHHCTKAFVQRYPCLGCGSAWFCSKLCRNLSRSYHSTECGLLPLLYSIGIAHLGFRIVLMAGLDKVLEYHNNTELRAKLPGVDSTYGKIGYDILYHLVSHTDTLAAEELYQYALTAAMLTLVLERRNQFLGSDASAKFIIGGHLLIHICQMVCNAHAITELCTIGNDTQNTVGERQERVAAAIYPSASLMNHNCNPTVINSFIGDCLVVRAVKDVAAGGEVFNCYGPHFRRMTRKERQEALSAQYSFTCRCEACLDVNSEDFQDVIHSFQCPSCKGPLVGPKANDPEDGQKAMCRSCHKLQDYFPQLRSDLEALSLDSRGSEAMELGDITQAIKYLSKCVQLRRSALYKAHPDLGRSADRLAQCYALLGKYEESALYLRITLAAVEEQYGRYSIEVANELQKFTDVLMEMAKERRDLLVLQELEHHLKEAALIYEIHYGVWSKSFKEIQTKLSGLCQLKVP